MRAGLVLIAVLALGATPVVAQGKTKGPATPQSVQVLEMCEQFAIGDVLAVDDAIAIGWDAYVQDSETLYVQSFAGSKELPGIGAANMFALIESYPNSTLGYCRVDVAEPVGDGYSAIQAIQELDRYEGQSQMVSDGNFATLTGRDDKNRLLLAHWSADSFVVQLSIITPKAETAD